MIGRSLSLGLALQGIMLTGIVAAVAVKALEAQYREKFVGGLSPGGAAAELHVSHP